MIGERARTLITRIEYLQTVKAQVDDADAFRTRAEQLTAILARFTPLIEGANALRAENVAGGEMADRVAGARAQLASIRQLYVAEPAGFATSQVEFAAFKRTIEQYASELEQRLRTAWSNYATARTPSMSAEILSILAKVPAFASSIADVRHGVQTLHRLALAMPSAAVITEFRRELARVSEALGKLTGKELPEEVREFLVAAAGYEGAALAMYTRAVQAWIEDNRVESSFQIRVASR